MEFSSMSEGSSYLIALAGMPYFVAKHVGFEDVRGNENDYELGDFVCFEVLDLQTLEKSKHDLENNFDNMLINNFGWCPTNMPFVSVVKIYDSNLASVKVLMKQYKNAQKELTKEFSKKIIKNL